MRLEGLLGDRPQQRAKITELHDNHNDSVVTLQINVKNEKSRAGDNGVPARRGRGFSP